MPWIKSVISDDRFTGIKSALHWGYCSYSDFIFLIDKYSAKLTNQTCHDRDDGSYRYVMTSSLRRSPSEGRWKMLQLPLCFNLQWWNRCLARSESRQRRERSRKSKPRKRSKKIRDEMASKPSPLLKFGFKKIKKSWCMCFHGYPFENWENHKAYQIC